MSDAVTHLQEEPPHCKNTIAKITTTFGQANVQIHPEALQGEKPPLISNHPSLQSNIQPGMPEDNFGSPGESTICRELKSGFMGKSPVKLKFPTYGRLNDTSDPFRYLERCEDFLSLNLHTDEELIAILCNVPHGTARDWWNVGCYKICTKNFGRTSMTTSVLPSCQRTTKMKWQRVCTVEFRERVKVSETLPTCTSHYASTGNQILKKRKS